MSLTDTALARTERALDEARAEAEMHKGLRAETLKANENLRAEVERLREALRSYGAHAPDCGDAHGCTCGYSAALAGSPVETRRPSASLALHDRALAERVREACAEADDFNADAADGLRCAIRALDLDALLEKP